MTHRIGAFHGVTSKDYIETNASQAIDTHFFTGRNGAFIPGRINFCFEFCRPGYSVDTACSPSLAAMHLACHALCRDDVDTAMADDTNMINKPDGHAGCKYILIVLISSSENLRIYTDLLLKHILMGVVTIIIKCLEDALADNDPILSVIL